LSKKYQKLNITTITIVIVIAFITRLVGINFGSPYTLQPDETKIIEPSLTMSLNIKDSIKGVGEYPFFYINFFFYPHLLYYILILVIQIAKFIFIPFGLFPNLEKFDFYLMARFLSVLVGTATVFGVYLISKMISKELKTGYFKTLPFLSSLIFAFSFLHVRQSHFYTGDVFATMWAVFSTLFFFRFLKKSKKLDFILTFLFVGFGISSKYYPALLIPLFVLMLITVEKINLRKVLQLIFLSLLFSAVGFLLFTPHLLTHTSEFLSAMKESSLRSKSGFMGASSKDIFYYIYNKDKVIDDWYSMNNLVDGLGAGVLAVWLAGLTFVAVGFKDKRYSKRVIFYWLLIIIIPTTYYLFFSMYFSRHIRWLTITTPFISILSAYGFLSIVQKFSFFRFSLLYLSFIFIFLFDQIYKVIKYDTALTRGDTSIQAYNWITANIPKDAIILYESFGIHDLYQNGSYNLIQISHPRYNTNGEYYNHLPFDYNKFLEFNTIEYVVLSGGPKIRYSNPSSLKYFLKTASSWLDFYASIEKNSTFLKGFNPEEFGLTGYPVRIFKVN